MRQRFAGWGAVGWASSGGSDDIGFGGAVGEGARLERESSYVGVVGVSYVLI
jgi:hypothetical protein